MTAPALAQPQLDVGQGSGGGESQALTPHGTRQHTNKAGFTLPQRFKRAAARRTRYIQQQDDRSSEIELIVIDGLLDEYNINKEKQQ